MFNCVLSLSHVLSWVRFCTWLHRFLIFATFFYFGRKILIWPFLIIVQMVLVRCISRSQRLKIQRLIYWWDGWGPMLWLLSDPTGLPSVFSFIYCWGLIFAYLLFISWFILGDYVLISKGYFMITKRLYVLIHIWTKVRMARHETSFSPPVESKAVLFCGLFMLFLSCFVMLSCASAYWCLMITCWERADLLAVGCDV